MNRISGRAGIVLLLVLFLLAGFSFFVAEYMINANDWVLFSGSPHVYHGGNIGCGEATDRNGILLLDMNGDRTYTPDLDLRKATVHWIGDRNGSISAPALPHYAASLAGYDLVNGVYHYGEKSGTAMLTLSAAAQKTALEAMGDYKGTVAVYNYQTGEILCAVTTPTYDPDNLPPNVEEDSRYEGIYVNRFTQSSYIPGSIFKIVTLAAALESIPDIQQQRFVCNGTYTVGQDKIICEDAHWEQNLQEAFRNSCNCAFAQIAVQLGAQTLDHYVRKFGITQSLTFDGIVTAEGNFEVLDASEVNVAWSAIGQYKDQVNPCAFLNFIGSIAGGGKGAKPYLVEQIKVGAVPTYMAHVNASERIVSEETAQILSDYLRSNVAQKYGDENFPGLNVCAKTGTGEVGGDKKPNAMFTGFVADEEYPLAFIVCVEDAGYGKTVCVPIASKVLDTCRKVLDGQA